MPIPNYDNLFVGTLIRAIENPDSAGYKDGKWFESQRKGDDPNNRGFGVDVKYNREASKIAEKRKGKWLSEEEERNLRNSHIDYSLGIVNKWTPKVLKTIPSETKEAIATGMVYRGDGIKTIINTPSLRNSYYEGTDKEFQNEVEKYYESKGLKERSKNQNKFMSTHRNTAVPTPVWGNNKFTPKIKLSEGGNINYWNKLSQYQKADIMKLALENGIYSLDDIKGIYNEYASGGTIK